jgi:hypothetical protein
VVPQSNLPAAPVHCSIRLAYQAADASHPRRVEQARRRARKFRRIRSILYTLHATKAPIGRALPRGKHKPLHIDSRERLDKEPRKNGPATVWNLFMRFLIISVCRAARLQAIVINCVLSSAPLQIARSSRTIGSPAVASPSKTGLAAGKVEAQCPRSSRWGRKLPGLEAQEMRRREGSEAQ